MNRKLYLTMTRALAALLTIVCISVSLVPSAPAARGAGTTAIAVIAPTNTAGAPPQVLQQVGQAIYDGLVASGQYDMRGGGPLNVGSTAIGESLGEAAAAASKVNASQVLLTDVLSVGGGKILYRMTTYRVDPLAFGRSQVFQTAFPAADPRAFGAQFATSLAALEAFGVVHRCLLNF